MFYIQVYTPDGRVISDIITTSVYIQYATNSGFISNI